MSACAVALGHRIALGQQDAIGVDRDAGRPEAPLVPDQRHLHREPAAGRPARPACPASACAVPAAPGTRRRAARPARSPARSASCRRARRPPPGPGRAPPSARHCQARCGGRRARGRRPHPARRQVRPPARRSAPRPRRSPREGPSHAVAGFGRRELHGSAARGRSGRLPSSCGAEGGRTPRRPLRLAMTRVGCASAGQRDDPARAPALGPGPGEVRLGAWSRSG